MSGVIALDGAWKQTAARLAEAGDDARARVAAVVFWNTRYLDAIFEHLRGSGAPVRDEDVAWPSRSDTRISTA